MNDVRKYGMTPFTLTVVHGGPGAPGEMAPVARELSTSTGVLEPLQSATSVDGQVCELKNVIEKNGNRPIILLGWSWGAWLSYIFTARYPSYVKKLILVSSGPFEDNYARDILTIRLNRLDEDEQKEVRIVINALANPTEIH